MDFEQGWSRHQADPERTWSLEPSPLRLEPVRLAPLRLAPLRLALSRHNKGLAHTDGWVTCWVWGGDLLFTPDGPKHGGDFSWRIVVGDFVFTRMGPKHGATWRGELSRGFVARDCSKCGQLGAVECLVDLFMVRICKEQNLKQFTEMFTGKFTDKFTMKNGTMQTHRENHTAGAWRLFASAHSCLPGRA